MPNPHDQASKSTTDNPTQTSNLLSNAVCCVADFSTNLVSASSASLKEEERKFVLYEIQSLYNSSITDKIDSRHADAEYLFRGGIPGLGERSGLKLIKRQRYNVHITGDEKTYYLVAPEADECNAKEAASYRYRCIPTEKERKIFDNKSLQIRFLSRFERCRQWLPEYRCYLLMQDPGQLAGDILSDFVGDIVIKCPSQYQGKGNTLFNLSASGVHGKLIAHLSSLQEKYAKELKEVGTEHYFSASVLVQGVRRCEKEGKGLKEKSFATYRAVLFYSEDGTSHVFLANKTISPDWDSHEWKQAIEYYKTADKSVTKEVYRTKSGKIAKQQVDRGENGVVTTYYRYHENCSAGPIKTKYPALHEILEELAKAAWLYLQAVETGYAVMLSKCLPTVVQSPLDFKTFVASLPQNDRSMVFHKLENHLVSWTQSHDDLKTILCHLDSSRWSRILELLIERKRLFDIINRKRYLIECTELFYAEQWVLINSALQDNLTEPFKTWAANFPRLVFNTVIQNLSEELIPSAVHLKAVWSLFSHKQKKAVFHHLKKEDKPKQGNLLEKVFRSTCPDRLHQEFELLAEIPADDEPPSEPPPDLVKGYRFCLNPETIENLSDLDLAFSFLDTVRYDDRRSYWSRKNPDEWLLSSSTTQTSQVPTKTVSLFFEATDPVNTVGPLSEDALEIPVQQLRTCS